MKSSMRLTLFSIIAGIILISFNKCSDSINPPDNAVILKEQQIIATPGFDWFSVERDNYQPDSSIVKEIKNLFNPNIYKLYLYASPCGCSSTHKPIADIIKTIERANFTDSVYIFLSMKNTSSHQPFDSLFKVHKLPSAFLTKNNIIVCSFIDTLDYYSLWFPDSIPTVESIFLKSLKN
jgi:hypothetical protein